MHVLHSARKGANVVLHSDAYPALDGIPYAVIANSNRDWGGIMSDLLFEIPKTEPEWKRLCEVHGITTTEDEYGVWTATYHEVSSEDTSLDISVTSPDVRTAAIYLLHKMRLKGWQRASINA